MKKLILLAFIIATTLVFGVTSFATDLNNTTSEGNTLVSTTIQPTYTVAIPASITIPYNDTEDFNVTPSNFRLNSGYKVTVSVSQEGGTFKLTKDLDSLPFELKKGSDPIASGVVFAEFGNAAVLPVTLTASVPDWTAAATAGTYNATLMFSIAYVVAN